MLEYDARETGLAFLPAMLIMGLLSWRYSERIVMRFGALNCLLVGMLLFGLSLTLYAQAPVQASYLVHVLPVMLLMGLGGGISFPALMNIAMSAATPQDAGLISGLIGTTAQMGGAIGLAVLATLAAERTKGLLAAGTAMPAALTSGYHLAFYIGAALLGAALVAALLLLRTPAPAGPDAEWDGPAPPLPSAGDDPPQPAVAGHAQ